VEIVEKLWERWDRQIKIRESVASDQWSVASGQWPVASKNPYVSEPGDQGPVASKNPYVSKARPLDFAQGRRWDPTGLNLGEIFADG